MNQQAFPVMDGRVHVEGLSRNSQFSKLSAVCHVNDFHGIYFISFAGASASASVAFAVDVGDTAAGSVASAVDVSDTAGGSVTSAADMGNTAAGPVASAVEVGDTAAVLHSGIDCLNFSHEAKRSKLSKSPLLLSHLYYNINEFCYQIFAFFYAWGCSRVRQLENQWKSNKYALNFQNIEHKGKTALIPFLLLSMLNLGVTYHRKLFNNTF